MGSISAALRAVADDATQQNRQIDQAAFARAQAAIAADGQVDDAEKAWLVDGLAKGRFDQGAVPAVAKLLTLGLPKPAAGPPKEAADPKAAAAATPAKKPSPWKHEVAVQGNFNYTEVSQGWTAKHANEVDETRLQISVKGDLNYEGPKNIWRNRVLLEYGTSLREDMPNQTLNNNLELTSEASHKVFQKGAFGLEIPYGALYTKGPLTTLDGRTFRETAGVKATYKTADTDASIKVGGGFQQKYAAAAPTPWSNAPGIELVAAAKQNFRFLQGPLGDLLDLEDEPDFLERLEAKAEFNAFNQFVDGRPLTALDVKIRAGVDYYLNKKKTVMIGVEKVWERDGAVNGTWEEKFAAHLGFKF